MIQQNKKLWQWSQDNPLYPTLCPDAMEEPRFIHVPGDTRPNHKKIPRVPWHDDMFNKRAWIDYMLGRVETYYAHTTIILSNI